MSNSDQNSKGITQRVTPVSSIILSEQWVSLPHFFQKFQDHKFHPSFLDPLFGSETGAEKQ